jgi:succinate-semialdehyde dehydrogenase/glutarate-semialdehyde dehydrogenase
VNVDKAVDELLTSKFRNSGQVCIAPNRVFIHRNIKVEFLAKLTKAVLALTQGNGLDDAVKVGPLISQASVEKVQAYVNNAIANGAKLICGGKVDFKLGNNFFEPTILDGMTDNMQISREETFGPVVAIFYFDSEKKVIERSNNTDCGLASYFFSEDIDQIRRVRNKLEYGMVGINTGLISSEKAPFGGIKESELGREGSDYAIYEFLEAKYSLQSFG